MKYSKSRVKELGGCPQKKGTCIRLFTLSPKKPNSAVRKVAKIFLTTKKLVLAYIPGEGHTLQRFNNVLIRGGRVKDLPGIRYKIIRGKLDCTSVNLRRQGRSKYGVKRWQRSKS